MPILVCSSSLGAQIVDLTKEELDELQASGGGILGHHVTALINDRKGQVPFGDIIAGFRSIRHDLLLRGRFLEPLYATPGQILQSERGTVGQDQAVQSSVRDDRLLRTLNHARENRLVGRGRGVAVSGEHAAVALVPFLVGRGCKIGDRNCRKRSCGGIGVASWRRRQGCWG